MSAGSYKLAGFLQKKGAKGMIKGWKKRFFILSPDNIIRYYDEFGFINLKDVTEVRTASTGENLFDVVTPTRIYELQASTSEEQETWISTLKAAMAGAPDSSDQSSSSAASSEEVSRLQSEVNGLKSEKSALQTQLREKNDELKRLRAELAAAKSSSSVAAAAASTTAAAAAAATSSSSSTGDSDSKPDAAAPAEAASSSSDSSSTPSAVAAGAAATEARAEPAKSAPAADVDPNSPLGMLSSSDEEKRLEGIATNDPDPLFESKLADLLADSSVKVQEAAARQLWVRQKDTHCSKTVESLRDEIRGHSMVDGKSTGNPLTLGHDLAQKALEVLLNFAPEEEKEPLQKLIDEMVIIESKIDSDGPPPGSVEFVETVTKGKYVYEVHRASCKAHALAFLKNRQVEKKLYYIEVETPDGTFGRDVEGMYDL